MPRHIWAFFFGSLFIVTGTIASIFGVITLLQFIFYGIIILFSGFLGVRKYRKDKDHIIKLLQDTEAVSIKQLSLELAMSEKRTHKLLADLRTDGRLVARFESNSDYFVVVKVDGKPPVISSDNKAKEEYSNEIKPQKYDYCPQCGSVLDLDDQYCRGCGSLIN